jgi:hypothetical protein
VRVVFPVPPFPETDTTIFLDILDL